MDVIHFSLRQDKSCHHQELATVLVVDSGMAKEKNRSQENRCQQGGGKQRGNHSLL